MGDKNAIWETTKINIHPHSGWFFIFGHSPYVIGAYKYAFYPHLRIHESNLQFPPHRGGMPKGHPLHVSARRATRTGSHNHLFALFSFLA